MRLSRLPALIVPSLFFLLIAVLQMAAQAPSLTVEWTAGEHASKVAEVPHVKWLDDNSAILYDERKPEAERTLERLDPATGQRTPVLNMSQAMASLKGMTKPAELEEAQIKHALP